MTKLPSLTPIQVIRQLKNAGFVFDRQAKGSHEIWYNPETKKRAVRLWASLFATLRQASGN